MIVTPADVPDGADRMADRIVVLAQCSGATAITPRARFAGVAAVAGGCVAVPGRDAG